MPEPGFEIYNKFYPLVMLQDWRWGDFAISFKMTGLNAEDLFGDKADSMLLQQVLIAVAVSRIQTKLSQEQLISFVQELKPSEVDEVGFQVTIEDTEGDASPPDGGEKPKENSSSESASTSTEGEPEKEIPETSGEPGLDTGSQE